MHWHGVSTVARSRDRERGPREGGANQGTTGWGKRCGAPAWNGPCGPPSTLPYLTRVVPDMLLLRRCPATLRGVRECVPPASPAHWIGSSRARTSRLQLCFPHYSAVSTDAHTQNCTESGSQVVCCKLPFLKALWIWQWTSQDFTNFPPPAPRCSRGENTVPESLAATQPEQYCSQAAAAEGSLTSAAKYMQRSKRGSVGAGRICSPFVASALLKLEGEPCLQAQEKIEQCQQPVLGFFLHSSHSPDPDERVQHKEQASNQSIEQHHQLHPGPAPLPFAPHRRGPVLFRSPGKFPRESLGSVRTTGTQISSPLPSPQRGPL